MDELNYKKFFLKTLIVALSISAVIGIFIFLAGDFGETEVRLLLTTLTIGGYSLTGLCSSTIHKYDKLKGFSKVGMVISILGFLITIATIWEVIDIEGVWKTMLIFVILAVAVSHISLLLLIQPKTKVVNNFRTSTIAFIAIVALMLINSTMSEFEEGEFYFRLLGVFAILDVLGTIATPIMNKIADSEG